MYTKKTYELVASIIKAQREDNRAAENDGIVDVNLSFLTWKFADKFAADNVKFDADKFFNATVDGVRRIGRGK